jgi:hypothetical protein
VSDRGAGDVTSGDPVHASYGQAAHIVLAGRDTLDRRTQVERVLLDGRSFALSDRSTELLESYERED